MHNSYECFMAALKNRVRAKQEIKQKDLADEIGVTESFLSMVFSGDRKAGRETQEKIALAFGVSHKDFLIEGDLILSGREPAAGSECQRIQHRRLLDEDPISQVVEIISTMKAKLEEATEEITLLKAFFEAMGEGILIINNDGRIEYQNRESRRLWNGNFIGQNYFEAISEKKGIENPVEKCLLSGVAQAGQARIAGRLLGITSSPVFNQNGQATHVVNMAREIDGEGK